MGPELTPAQALQAVHQWPNAWASRETVAATLSLYNDLCCGNPAYLRINQSKVLRCLFVQSVLPSSTPCMFQVAGNAGPDFGLEATGSPFPLVSPPLFHPLHLHRAYFGISSYSLLRRGVWCY